MKKIILLVDVQNGFVKNAYAEKVLYRIVDLLERDLFDVVIASKYWNVKGSYLSRFMGWNELCTPEEQALRPEIAQYPQYCVEKDGYSSMTEEMVSLLRDINGGDLPEYVFALGFDTECCVAMTATDMFEMGIRPLVLTRYSGSHDGDEYHNAGLVSMDHLIGPDFLIEDELKTPEDVDRVLNRVMAQMEIYEEAARH
ncbi:MAG: cysteine hydrolase [Firmicutes bacterium]|nr:cysteine hydrolase [Bacillota bacterium]